MFIKIIFYIIEFVELLGSLVNSLFYDSRIFSLIKNEIDSLEKQLQKFTFITLIIGVAVLFYSYKLFVRIFSTLLNKFVLSKKANPIEMKEINTELISKFVHLRNYDNIELEFKEDGQNKQEVINKFMRLKEEDDKLQSEKKIVNGPVYTKDKDIQFVANENLYSNLLHPDIFSGCRFIESELIRVSLELFKGNQDCCGISTYCGTESICLAILAYRNYAASKGISAPEIIVPITAHAGFNKACKSFGLKLVEIPLNNQYQVDLEILNRSINNNTVCIGASYPNNINGVCDNISEISKIASKNRIPFHVDASLGGLLVPFHCNENLSLCDFTVKGITSISIDFHKYGLAPQAISVLMYSDREYRKNHYFIYNQWAGGIYPCSGFPGSRTPAVIVSALSTLLYLGKNFYVKQAILLSEKVELIKKFIRNQCSDIEIVGNPKICLVAFKGSKIGFIYNTLKIKNWELNFCYKPYGFQFLVTMANSEKVDSFLQDFKEAYLLSKTYDKIDKEEVKPSISNEYYDSYIDYMLGFVKN